MKYRIFISSVQKEFAEARQRLAEHIENDPICGRFFEVFLFERLPARARSVEDVYLGELKNSDIYLGLFGKEYGWEDANGVSPTQKEFDYASELNLPRLIFISAMPGEERHPKMAALIRSAEAEIVRKAFHSTADLLAKVSASLADFLEEKKAFRHGAFDAEACPGASLKDISRKSVELFIERAQEARNFPLPKRVSIERFLTHLNLLKDGVPTYAAILLFGKQPQRFLLSTEVKCAHFHGTCVEKPIPSYQVYQGTLFEMVDSAVDFILSKINFSVGTRHLDVRVPTAYEIPKEVVLEAIVNAVAHRDYTSNGSVQVMLFADRLEVRNPGLLPRQLTIPDLSRPHSSYPPNELIAKGLYYAKYIERMGTGTEDMVARCLKAGLQPPKFELNDGFTITVFRNASAAFQQVKDASGEGRQICNENLQTDGRTTPVITTVTTPVTTTVTTPVTTTLTTPVRRLIELDFKEAGIGELMTRLGIKDKKDFHKRYIRPALAAHVIVPTQPDSLHSPTQKYRMTEEGCKILASLQNQKSK